jgi:hypothetical protein
MFSAQRAAWNQHGNLPMPCFSAIPIGLSITAASGEVSQTWVSERRFTDLEPEFMPLEEQRELFAQRIKQLGRFQFLLRPALAEGDIGSAVLPLSIRDVDRDKKTGAYQFPDPTLIARVRRALAAQSGIPVQTLLQEQENRLRSVPAGSLTSGQRGAGQHQPHQKQADFMIRLPSRPAARSPGTAIAPEKRPPPTQRRRRISQNTDG